MYWSHLSAYEECAQKYLWYYGWGDIDLGRGPGRGKPKPQDKSGHHAVMGIVIQAVLEDFYNKEFWKTREDLRERLTKLTREKLATVCTKHYISWKEISYEEMEEVCLSGVLGFLKTMKQHKLLGIYARSEVELFGHAESWLPLAGRADFVIRRDDLGIRLLDGKNSGTKMKYVDPDQLRWYALAFHLSYHQLPQQVGFVWFRYPYDAETGEEGIDWVDFTKRDLVQLVDRARTVRRGQEKEAFKATPVAKVCRFCDFETVCPERQQARAENAAKRRKGESLPIFDETTDIVEFGFGTE
jgi:hypothetical protein